ncbi:MAG: hypothetical protein Q8R73_10915 [Bradyrhizobium sp.]|nr:hypothetical protein [Bradyrhizobium sp.]
MAFATASLALIAMSLALLGVSAAEFYRAATGPRTESRETLFSAIGNVIIAVAVLTSPSTSLKKKLYVVAKCASHSRHGAASISFAGV